MKDRWINAGFDEDELKPFVEPELDISDQKRIGNTNSFFFFSFSLFFSILPRPHDLHDYLS